MPDERQLVLGPGPHLRQGWTTARIMWWVSASLLPAFLWATYLYGLRVVGLAASGVAGAVAGEWLVLRLRRERGSLRDGSAVLTGLLLVGTVSPGLPLWMPATGGFFAIVFAKHLFGGLGFNVFNPALIGRAFLMVTFPVAMTTTWIVPQPGHLLADAVTQASPLMVLKLEGLSRAVEILGIDPAYYGALFLGYRVGAVGEVSVLLIAVGAAILLARGIIRFHIPLSVIAGLAFISLCSRVPLFHLLTGGLWFGAFYMATDYVTAPMMPKGQIIFGLGVGCLTGAIRLWGGYPEGICYAILIMNAMTPALNQWFRPARPQAWGAPS